MKYLLAAALVAGAAPAAADELRDLCPDRPGLGTPPCIVDAGHVLVELGLASWERSHDDTSVTQEVIAGDLLARIGITGHLEAFAGWTAYGHDRIRDRATGGIERRHGTGDIVLGLKQSLLSPGGDGTSIAVQISATAPSGSNGFGAGGWTQTLIVPVQFDLGNDTALSLSPEVDRLPDSVRAGHHVAWQNVVGLSHQFGKIDAEVEMLISRDQDPGANVTIVLAGANLAWQAAHDFQLDAEVDAGLNRNAPDVRIAVGLARHF